MRGREASSGLRRYVRDDAIDWEATVGLASEQFCLSSVGASLRDLDLDQYLEPELRDFLGAVHEANRERNELLRAQLLELSAQLNAVGINPLLLKGAIRLVDELYPDLGWRLMWDLDLLVTAGQLDAALTALGQLGYRPIRKVDSMSKDIKLWGPRLGTVEIHTELFAFDRQRRLQTGLDMIAGSKLLLVEGVRFRVPRVTEQWIHLIGHSQIGHFGHIYGRVSLRDRLEAAALMRWSAASADWDAIHARFEAAGYKGPLRTFVLALREGDFGAPPVSFWRGPVTTMQKRRVALQARSQGLRSFSLLVGWWVVLAKLQLMQQQGGRRRLFQSVRRLVMNPEERQRMIRKLLTDGPRIW